MIFSVIVPFINEEKYIRGCIAALLEQDFPEREYELIFIDNGSSDASASIVKQFDRVKLLELKERNVYFARNKGLEEASGDIVAFTDADCVVSKDWLKQIYALMKNPDILIALGNVSFNCKNSFILKIFQDYQNVTAEYTVSNFSRRKYFGFNSLKILTYSQKR